MSSLPVRESYWWVKEWYQELEDYLRGHYRLPQGQMLFANGAVKQLHIEKEFIKGQIEDISALPAEVQIQIQAIPIQEWSQIFAKVIQQPLLAVSLLAEELPEDLKDIFSLEQVALVPVLSHEVKATCSCSDSLTPCKHVIAAYYALGEKIGAEPSALLLLKGFEKKHLLSKLLESWMGNAVEEMESEPSPKEGHGRAIITTTTKQEEQQIDLPPAEVGYSALRKAHEQGSFWEAGEYFKGINVHVFPDIFSPDSLPLTWGNPDFFGKHGEFAVAFLCSVMRDVSQRAQQEIKK